MDSESQCADEYVSSVQGVLLKYNLPPVQDKTQYVHIVANGHIDDIPIDDICRLTSSRTAFLEQSVTLSGLGTAAFAECVKGMRAVDYVFGMATKENSYESWVEEKCDGDDVLTFTNRYFTPKVQAQGAPVLELGPDLDPRGVLSKAAGNTHVHIDENVVKYFHKRKVLDRCKM